MQKYKYLKTYMLLKNQVNLQIENKNSKTTKFFFKQTLVNKKFFIPLQPEIKSGLILK